MRVRVSVSVEVLADDAEAGERVIGSATAERAYIVGHLPAYDSDLRFAADTAGPVALRRATSGAIAAAGLGEGYPHRRVVDAPQA